MWHAVGVTGDDATVLAGEHKVSIMYIATIKYAVEVISISPSMVVGMYELLPMVFRVYHVLSQSVGGVLLCVRRWCSPIYDFLVFFVHDLMHLFGHEFTVMSCLP
jgi:hypothetical protein